MEAASYLTALESSQSCAAAAGLIRVMEDEDWSSWGTSNALSAHLEDQREERS